MREYVLLIAAAALATAACGPRNSDKLDDNELASAEGRLRPDATDDRRCGASATHAEVKRQLFARAAEIRGANADAYARIAEFALLEVDAATSVGEPSTGALVDCRGTATLRLPTGLRVAGGRTALGGDIAFTVGQGTRGAVTLGQSDAIAIPLATLTQVRAAPPPPTVPIAPVDPLAPAPEPAPAAPAPAQLARPSFDCRLARSQSEQAVCADPMLAELDRDMAARYRAAFASANSSQARLLGFTRDRFLVHRDRCATDSCIAAAYRGRMREIDDIMADRWRGTGGEQD